MAFSSIRAVTVEPGQGVYAATKAGLVQLLRTAAAEFGPHGVRVNAVAPGSSTRPRLRRSRWSRRRASAYAGK
ncbi:MAG: SDR family oxidoreductase [Dermatophilaceae bacterium]